MPPGYPSIFPRDTKRYHNKYPCALYVATFRPVREATPIQTHTHSVPNGFRTSLEIFAKKVENVSDGIGHSSFNMRSPRVCARTYRRSITRTYVCKALSMGTCVRHESQRAAVHIGACTKTEGEAEEKNYKETYMNGKKGQS